MPVDLTPGHYWFEGVIVGPENNFWLEGDVINEEGWVDFDDFGGLQPISRIKGVACDLVFALEGSRVESVRFEYPDGPPERIPPCGGAVRIEIEAPEGAALDPGSPMLHYDDGDGFVAVPLDRISFVVYDVIFPPTECGRAVQYYVSAATTDGVTFFDPPTAPTQTRDATSATGLVVAFEDDMEEDRGWTVESTKGTEGVWVRAVPAGGSEYAPTEDFDGSGQCWLAGVDEPLGGTTRLISPAIDLDGAVAALVDYGRWFSQSNQIGELEVDVSPDNGATWSAIERAPHRNGWQTRQALRFPGHIPLTSQMRLRYTASGSPVTVAALDAFRIVRAECDVSCPADLDCTGAVDFADLLAILGAWGNAGGAEDLDGSGTVDFGDLLIVLAAWGPCE